MKTLLDQRRGKSIKDIVSESESCADMMNGFDEIETGFVNGRNEANGSYKDSYRDDLNSSLTCGDGLLPCVYRKVRQTICDDDHEFWHVGT